MRKERRLKQNPMRTRHMWVPARATNYHPSKRSSMAMSRALIFSSTQHPHLNLVYLEPTIFSHPLNMYSRDGIALLMHFNAWDMGSFSHSGKKLMCFLCPCLSLYFSVLASVIVIRQTHKKGYNFCVKHFRYVSKCFCILCNAQYLLIWFKRELELELEVERMRMRMSAHQFPWKIDF